MCQGNIQHPAPLDEGTIAVEQARLADLLSADEHRVTAPRLAIYEVLLRANDHICVEHILSALAKDHALLRIDKSTVYRTLDLLMDLDLVSEMRHADGSAQYELTLHGPHGHLLCNQCGRVQDVPLAELLAIQQRIGRDHGFRVDLHDRTLPGICAACQEGHAA